MRTRPVLATVLAVALVACQAVFGIEHKELAPSADAATDAADVPADGADDGYVPDPEPADCHDVDPKYGVSRYRVPTDGADGTNYVVEDLVVTDKTTGLMWQRATGRASFADAKCDCANLVLRGLTDWRLPSLAELSTIVDYAKNPDTMGTGTTEPVINLAVFPDTGLTTYWTTSPGLSKNLLSLDFVDGQIIEITDMGVSPDDYRCVRTDARPAAEPPARFVIQGGTARDVLTGLTWARSSSPTALTYAESAGYCASLTVDGAAGFRLPNVKELFGLVDARIKGSPKLDKLAFPMVDGLAVFASTRYAADPQRLAWKVDLTDAENFRGIQSDPVKVLCVK